MYILECYKTSVSFSKINYRMYVEKVHIYNTRTVLCNIINIIFKYISGTILSWQHPSIAIFLSFIKLAASLYKFKLRKMCTSLGFFFPRKL